MKKANDLLYTGDSASAPETERLGIVNRGVPAEKLEEETQAMTGKPSIVPPEVMRITKQPIS
jgi:enoyl-CoA hydratase/3-hydroxyacyl-CoA dehydrogenase